MRSLRKFLIVTSAGFIATLALIATILISSLPQAPVTAVADTSTPQVRPTSTKKSTSKKPVQAKKVKRVQTVKPVVTVAPKRVARPAPAPKPVIRSNTLSIPAIGLTAPIVSVGTTANNAIAVPAGMQVGHWNGSATPGTAGSVFLDGHVDGVFAGLSRLGVGQTLKLTYNKKSYRYRVAYRETVALQKVDMTKAALSVHGTSTQGVNMMTCAGSYSSKLGTYTHRLIIYSVRVY